MLRHMAQFYYLFGTPYFCCKIPCWLVKTTRLKIFEANIFPMKIRMDRMDLPIQIYMFRWHFPNKNPHSKLRFPKKTQEFHGISMIFRVGVDPKCFKHQTTQFPKDVPRRLRQVVGGRRRAGPGGAAGRGASQGAGRGRRQRAVPLWGWDRCAAGAVSWRRLR